MRPLHWDSTHSIFLPEIDAEHRTLFRLANELLTAVLSRASDARIEEALQALATHVEEHFSHEERLMRSSDYETYPWHKRQHDGIRYRIKRTRKRFAAGDRDAILALVEHVIGWLRDHTSITDRMMGAYLRNYERRQAVLAS